jgi:hypothetical protein
MQYFKPEQEDRFVGDCMPFFHDGTFRLYYLLDEQHHGALGGLGGHQWAHASSTDLVHWTHHPLAIPITEPWEGSICTGSAFVHAGTYYGFYATRTRGKKQHLSLAVSGDGVHFHKTEPNPLASPPQGYSAYHYRDPFVFQDAQTGLFHALVTAQLENHPVPSRGGCLAHLVSSDLLNWRAEDPFLVPGDPGPPECPDYFEWNGWYYLVFSTGLTARYRVSRQPFGPWLRPKTDILDGPFARVMKTARFAGGRRIGVAWLGTREGDKDNGRFQWGGNAVFREIVQHDDGTLGTRFPAEMAVPTGRVVPLPFTSLTPGATETGGVIRLEAPQGLEVGMFAGLPQDVRITAQVRPKTGTAAFGLRLRGSGRFESGYDLCFVPSERRVVLHDASLFAVDGLDKPFSLEIVLFDDIIDVCIDRRRCLLNRCPGLRGDGLFLFCQNGGTTFERIEILS